MYMNKPGSHWTAILSIWDNGRAHLTPNRFIKSSNVIFHNCLQYSVFMRCLLTVFNSQYLAITH